MTGNDYNRGNNYNRRDISSLRFNQGFLVIQTLMEF